MIQLVGAEPSFPLTARPCAAGAVGLSSSSPLQRLVNEGRFLQLCRGDLNTFLLKLQSSAE